MSRGGGDSRGGYRGGDSSGGMSRNCYNCGGSGHISRGTILKNINKKLDKT